LSRALGVAVAEEVVEVGGGRHGVLGVRRLGGERWSVSLNQPLAHSLTVSWPVEDLGWWVAEWWGPRRKTMVTGPCKRN
jgi:hypothetical protein